MFTHYIFWIISIHHVSSLCGLSYINSFENIFLKVLSTCPLSPRPLL